MRQRAVFLDRDGVININRSDYVKSWDEFEFLPGSLDALVRLKRAGLPIIIVSNQAGVGRGIIPHTVVDDIHTRMALKIQEVGGKVDKIYYCPHLPSDGCSCRKPKPGLMEQAAQELDLDLQNSFLVGDTKADIEAALAVSCYPILVLTGHGTVQVEAIYRSYNGKFHLEENLTSAVEWISSQLGL